MPVIHEETSENLLFLLGKTAEEFIAENSLRRISSIIKLNRDLVGSGGWQSEKEMMSILQVISKFKSKVMLF